MVLFGIWVCFVLLTSLFQELSQLYYLIFSFLMLSLTYFINKNYPFEINRKLVVTLLAIPSLIFWYILFIYNNFLCLSPVDDRILLSLLVLHVCILPRLWQYKYFNLLNVFNYY